MNATVTQVINALKLFFKHEPPQSGTVKGKYYTRTGQCHQCADCCKDISLLYRKAPILSISQFRDIQQRDSDYQIFEPLTHLAYLADEPLRFRCIHIDENNQCGIYSNRPTLCRMYPSENTLLLGGELSKQCGYQFEALQKFESVLKKTRRTQQFKDRIKKSLKRLMAMR